MVVLFLKIYYFPFTPAAPIIAIFTTKNDNPAITTNFIKMLFINPQWQGSGLTDELKFGAETFNSYFENVDKRTIPLSTKELVTLNNILCYEAVLEQTTIFKQIIAESNLTKVSTVGGDCGIEIVPISYLNKIYQGDICIVYIDAHADLNTPESSPSKAFHGMPLRTLLGDGNEAFVGLLFSTLRPEQLCYVGLRDLDEPEKEYILKHTITSIADCQFAKVQEKAKDFKNVYIHLDLDVLHKSEFAFSMFPSSNGLLVADVAELIRKLREKHHVVGFCITESIPKTLSQIDSIKPILDQIEI